MDGVQRFEGSWVTCVAVLEFMLGVLFIAGCTVRWCE